MTNQYRSLERTIGDRKHLPRLLTAEQLAAKLHGMLSAARLTELADLEVLPCVRCAGGPPLFQEVHTKQFIRDNLLSIQEGRVFPRIVGVPTADASVVVPLQLRSLAGYVKRFDRWSVGSGVYFLLLAEIVVYVGQSLEVARRVCDHVPSKEFDEVYFLTIAPAELMRVEKAFIKYFRPKYNTEIFVNTPLLPQDAALVARYVAVAATSRSADLAPPQRGDVPA